MITDHRGYIVDIHLEDYFNKSLAEVDKRDNSRINTRKLFHCTKFTEKVDKLLDQTNLEQLIDKNCNSYSTKEELETIDNMISEILNKVKKFVEGPCRNIPHSITKVIIRTRLL